jgi:hypothetical protein
MGPFLAGFGGVGGGGTATLGGGGGGGAAGLDFDLMPPLAIILGAWYLAALGGLLSGG